MHGRGVAAPTQSLSAPPPALLAQRRPPVPLVLQAQRSSRVAVKVQAAVSRRRRRVAAAAPIRAIFGAPAAWGPALAAPGPGTHPCAPPLAVLQQLAPEQYITEVPESLLRPGIDDPNRCAPPGPVPARGCPGQPWAALGSGNARSTPQGLPGRACGAIHLAPGASWRAALRAPAAHPAPWPSSPRPPQHARPV